MKDLYLAGKTVVITGGTKPSDLPAQAPSGLTDTSWVAEGLQADAVLACISETEARQRSVERIPMGRLADPVEIARVVLFLASGPVSYLTGVSITMDRAAASIIV